MNYSVFPSQKRDEVRARAEQKKRIVDQESNKKINTKKTDTNKENERASKLLKAPGKTSDFIAEFGGIGVLLSFLVCCVGCYKADFNGIEDAYGYTGIALGIGGFILGAIVGIVANSSYKNSVKNNENATQRRNQDAEATVATINQYRNEKKAEIDREANREYTEYLKGFEDEAKTHSVRFAESELAIKVINWITDGFVRTIEATDRRSHIEKIIVPFIFNVYRDKITCNLGEFNFEIERCRNLENPIEQTALARAIASSVQINITMKFPKDPSGTSIVMDTDYEYYDDHVSTVMKYTAPNGNFEAVKGW